LVNPQYAATVFITVLAGTIVALLQTGI
jgi:hypothetical protein